MSLAGMCYTWRLSGGAKSCLLPVGTAHGGSYGAVKLCPLLLDRRWCECGSDGRRGDMGRLCLSISPPVLSEYRTAGQELMVHVALKSSMRTPVETVQDLRLGYVDTC
jgi:hypothetical protein